MRAHLVALVLLALLPALLLHGIAGVYDARARGSAHKALLGARAEWLAGEVDQEIVRQSPLLGATPTAVAGPSQSGHAPSVERLESLLRNRFNHEGEVRALLNERGCVVAASARSVLTSKTCIEDRVWAHLTEPQLGDAEVRVGRNALLAGVAAPALLPGWRAIVAEPLAIYESEIGHAIGEIVSVALLSLFLGLIGAVVVGSRLVEPIRRLTADAEAVASGADALEGTKPSAVVEFDALRASVERADIVLRRRAAAERLALQEARTGHELLELVVNGTADPIYVKDLNLEFVLANRAALVAGNVRREEWQVLGLRARAIMPPDLADAEEAQERDVIATGELRTRRVDWWRASGEIGSFTTTKTPWRDVSGRIAGVVTVMHDDTDQRAAEQRLAAVQGELLRVTRLSAMGAMASGLAHELNQPLAAATNYLNASGRLLARPTLDEPTIGAARSALNDAVGQTLRAGAIVRRLRDFVGRGEADLKVESVGELVREICAIARADGALPEERLVTEVRNEGCVALVDRTQIQQVVLNLVRNSDEAMGELPDGRIAVATQLSRAGDVEITVADNGPGFAPGIRDKLFQPFASTKALGMGIGLAICRTIVEGHGGRLEAADVPTGGALFRIILPPVTPDASLRGDERDAA